MSGLAEARCIEHDIFRILVTVLPGHGKDKSLSYHSHRDFLLGPRCSRVGCSYEGHDSALNWGLHHFVYGNMAENGMQNLRSPPGNADIRTVANSLCVYSLPPASRHIGDPEPKAELISCAAKVLSACVTRLEI